MFIYMERDKHAMFQDWAVHSFSYHIEETVGTVPHCEQLCLSGITVSRLSSEIILRIGEHPYRTHYPNRMSPFLLELTLLTPCATASVFL